MKHWARAKGSSWYMPEARSLYMMLRSVNATGCTVMELMMPRNSMARYKLPKMLPKSWAVDLHIQHTGLYQMTAVDYWQFASRSVGDCYFHNGNHLLLTFLLRSKAHSPTAMWQMVEDVLLHRNLAK